MNDNKNNKKKGFFSRLFGGFGTPKETQEEVSSNKDILELPNKSALNKMKKADIVQAAKENGLDLDINLTKAKLLEAWDLHFNQSSLPSAVDDAAKVMAEVAVKEDTVIEETSDEESTPADEETSEEEVAVEEEASADEAPLKKKFQLKKHQPKKLQKKLLLKKLQLKKKQLLKKKRLLKKLQ